jgi:hypothetical protein
MVATIELVGCWYSKIAPGKAIGLKVIRFPSLEIDEHSLILSYRPHGVVLHPDVANFLV